MTEPWVLFHHLEAIPSFHVVKLFFWRALEYTTPSMNVLRSTTDFKSHAAPWLLKQAILVAFVIPTKRWLIRKCTEPYELHIIASPHRKVERRSFRDFMVGNIPFPAGNCAQLVANAKLGLFDINICATVRSMQVKEKCCGTAPAPAGKNEEMGKTPTAGKGEREKAPPGK
jgi:hypothetical protein